MNKQNGQLIYIFSVYKQQQKNEYIARVPNEYFARATAQFNFYQYYPKVHDWLHIQEVLDVTFKVHIHI